MVCQKVFDVVNPMINHAINQTFGLILHQSHLGEIMCFSIWFNVVNPVITNHPQYHYLVGGLEHFFIFPYILRRIIPTDEVIFFRWVGLNHQAAIWIGSLSPRGPGGSRIEVYLQPHSEALGLPRNVPWVPGRSGKIREEGSAMTCKWDPPLRNRDWLVDITAISSWLMMRFLGWSTYSWMAHDGPTSYDFSKLTIWYRSSFSHW